MADESRAAFEAIACPLQADARIRTHKRVRFDRFYPRKGTHSTRGNFWMAVDHARDLDLLAQRTHDRIALAHQIMGASRNRASDERYPGERGNPIAPKRASQRNRGCNQRENEVVGRSDCRSPHEAGGDE